MEFPFVQVMIIFTYDHLQICPASTNIPLQVLVLIAKTQQILKVWYYIQNLFDLPFSDGTA